jgi:aspartyl-tRNA(Asn)/glutamyl-tRNA(Gln) amidotransferase subunit C
MLTLQEVEHIARLARLTLTDEEKERFRRQLSEILEYAARLQALDTGDILPTFSVLPPQNVLRADEIQRSLDTEDILRNAAKTEKYQFRVPPVLDIP